MNKQELKIYFNKSIASKRLSHAYLFTGEDGLMMQEMAIWLSKRVLCLHVQNGEPCNECKNCVRINNNTEPDVHYLQEQNSTIKVEQIQKLREEFSLSSLEGNIKIFVINDVALLTESAANRLLTFLEEPKINMLAILITTKPEAVLKTIKSRCQLLYFNEANNTEIYEELVNNGINNKLAQIASLLTNNIQRAQELVNSEDFQKQLELAKKWAKLLENKDMRAFVLVQQELVQSFKDKNTCLQLLDILAIYFSLSEQMRTKVQCFDIIVTAKEMLNANVVSQNVLEYLALQILDL